MNKTQKQAAAVAVILAAGLWLLNRPASSPGGYYPYMGRAGGAGPGQVGSGGRSPGQ